MNFFQDIVDFIRRINPVGDFIPLHAPVFRGREKEYLQRCIDSSFVSSVGEFVDLFEHELKEYTGAASVVAVMNGTAALHVALRMVDVRYGDLVITQPLAFVASCNAIAQIGASPAFVDIDPHTLGMDPADLQNFLESECAHEKETIHKVSGKRIAACVPMHTFGHPVNIEEIARICKEWSIPLIEDAAEALGSYRAGRHTGLTGRCGILSFNGNKTITTGGGGAIITIDEEFGRTTKYITTTAKVPHRWDFVHDQPGFNYRMPNINAALGCAQMEGLSTILAEKRSLADEYREYFNGTPWTFIDEPENCRSNFWLNSVLTSGPRERDDFLAFSNDREIMTRPVWELMINLPMFADCPQSADLGNSLDIRGRLVNLPSGISCR